eukprot:403366757
MDVDNELNLKTIKGYEMTWQAKSRSCCKGRFFIGPKSLRWITFSIILLIVGMVYMWIRLKPTFMMLDQLHFSYEESKYKQNINEKSFYIPYNICIFYFELLLTIILLYNFIVCAFSDPGVVFRHKDYDKLMRNTEVSQFSRKISGKKQGRSKAQKSQKQKQQLDDEIEMAQILDQDIESKALYHSFSSPPKQKIQIQSPDSNQRIVNEFEQLDQSPSFDTAAISLLTIVLEQETSTTLCYCLTS